MREIGPSSEPEMILAFLRAEVDSIRFGDVTRQFLGDMRLVSDEADPTSPTENAARRAALANTRGYGVGMYLFIGFPATPRWRRVALDRQDLGALKYANANAPAWTVLSGGSCLVRDGAENVGVVSPIPEDADKHILAVEETLRQGKTYPELIVAAERIDAEHHLVEGHTRATAYYRYLEEGATDEYEAIVAYEPEIKNWHYF